MAHQTESPWSATKGDIHSELERILKTEENAALATVVAVEGSGYRRPGAKMIVDNSGRTQGSVTAGCLEGEVGDLARDILGGEGPRTVTYNLTDDDTDMWGLGLGCNGVIDILIEPIDHSLAPVSDELSSRRDVTVVTAVESSDPDVSVGDRATQTKASLVSVGHRSLPTAVASSALDQVESLSKDAATCVTVETEDGEVKAFVDRITPPPDLLLFGGQEDINPVVSLSKRAGFRVTVATARGARADSGRFPAADDVVASHPTSLPDKIESPKRTYAVLMSHNLVDDRLALDTLLDTAVPYVGVMGPRKRFQELADDLDLSEHDTDRIAAPVGLDLGSNEPTAIGFSIVGELLAVHNDRTGGRLVDRDAPVHDRPEL